MFRFAILCLIAWITMPSCYQASKAQQEITSAIPVLRIKNDTLQSALRMAKLAIDVVVTGNIATTTFDITFFNPYDKILEGEFEFPLADGQHIARYALDINGNLREGVVVEKTKARIAFENTVRREIDPGLAEKTKGNNFRTRIYPIPAKGFKRVVIGIEELLGVDDKGLFYRLPLYSPEPIGDFSIKTTVLSGTVMPVLKNNGVHNFLFKKLKNAWIAEEDQQNFQANTTLDLRIPYPGRNEVRVFTEDYKGKSYFYMHMPVEGKYAKKPKPQSLLLLWDISASARKREIEKELALIEKYISSLQTLSVELVAFNILSETAERFDITNGNGHALLQRIRSFQFDGGTQLGAIDLTKYKAEEILMFTDGLSTFGHDKIRLSGVPVTLVNSSPQANYSYLKYVARESNGKFIDLAGKETTIALNELTGTSLNFISATYTPGEIAELYPGTSTNVQNGFSISGITNKLPAAITLNFGHGNKIMQKRIISIQPGKTVSSENVKRIWASMKIDHLDMEYELNKDQITSLGKEFSIVTRNTSFLVLDRLEDYVQYEITPPVELQKEYHALLKEMQHNKQDEEALAMQEAIQSMKALTGWWNNHFPKPEGSGEISRFTPPRVRADDASRGTINSISDSVAVVSQEGIAEKGVASVTRPSRVNEAPPPVPRTFGAEEQNEIRAEEQNEMKLEDVQFYKVDVSGMNSPGEQNGAVQVPASDIQLGEWKPDAPYLTMLESTTPVNYFKTYISLRKTYENQPSFFVDVARFFSGKNNKRLALLVLSNVCEMTMEDAELLRIVAYQLLESEETALAIETFKEIVNIREEDPQAHRDLALALGEAGQHNEAAKLMYKVVTGVWSNRFQGVRTVALNELNAMISAHPGEVNTAGMDSQLIMSMPVDVRIVLSWSADNSDVDLWVTEPGKEKCDYENPSTTKGGRISDDMTQGFGPEEYLIKNADNGSYHIQANLYGDSRQTLGGPVTVKGELFTNYGRPSQKRKLITFRVTTPAEVVHIGDLNF